MSYKLSRSGTENTCSATRGTGRVKKGKYQTGREFVIAAYILLLLYTQGLVKIDILLQLIPLLF